MTLARLSDLKERLGITDAADDIAMLSMMAGLEGRMEERCARTWALGAYSQWFSGGVRQLLLKAFPVQSILAISINGIPLTESDYTLDLVRGRILNADELYDFPSGKIEVQYRGGFVPAGQMPVAGETPVPAGLAEAFLMQACYEWRYRQTFGAGQMNDGGTSVNTPATWLPLVEQVLAVYTRF